MFLILRTVPHEYRKSARFKPKSKGDQSEMNAPASPHSEATVQPLKFTTLTELYTAPLEPVAYCVEDLLPTCGLSVLAGKPKAGKSTLARQLAVAVAQGSEFLQRRALKGTVLYLAIEEKQSEVITHFKQLGCAAGDPVGVLFGAVKKDSAVAQLQKAIEQVPEAQLVIVDPLFKFVGVQDSSDYVQVSNALERLLELARTSATHILVVHHQKKKETEDIMDGALGSTAISAGADTYIALKCSGSGRRTITTRQRYGSDMPETELAFDPETRQFSLGITCSEAQLLAATATERRIEADILSFIALNPSCSYEAMLNAVHGKTVTKKKVFQEMLDSGQLDVSGAGVKGQPHTYKLAAISIEGAFDHLTNSGLT